MTEFICMGTLTLADVTFYIEAETLEEAIKLAKAQKWVDYDVAGSGAQDWTMKPSTVEENI